ncbi:MAG TPA: phosphatase PAP2 family protein [Anaerolineales bacterium]|nr:phosphatase PAP2 family protein [Anaerolineales bacterium]HLE72685.1 phosphatase PAP2 family protein [Anaerolineales bacterium]
MKALFELDARLSARLRVAEQPGKRRRLAIIFGHSGDSWFWLPGLLILAWLGDEGWRRLALALILGILLTAVVVLLIKFSVRRQRPEGEWGQVYRRTDPHSFPSGHAARALMLAVVALALGPAWSGWLLLVWAPLVGLARVATGLHYVSDVLVGWVLGLLMGFVTLQVAGVIGPL